MIIINMANEWHTKEGTIVRRSRRPQTQLIAFREAPCAQKRDEISSHHEAIDFELKNDFFEKKNFFLA